MTEEPAMNENAMKSSKHKKYALTADLVVLNRGWGMV